MGLSVGHYYWPLTINKLYIKNKKYAELHKLGIDNLNISYQGLKKFHFAITSFSKTS